MPVHGIDNGNNKHEVYTTEELLSILQQAINSGSLQGIDPTQTPIVAAVRESHNNSDVTFWSGTEAEFNELTGVTSELIGARIGSDGKLYLLSGDTTLSDTIQACYDAALEATEGMKREVISVTLLANAWSNTAPYTQTVAVAGMTADKDFLAPYVVPTGNESDDIAAQAALSCISGGTTDTDSVTFYCYDEKPTTTITVFMVDKGTKIEPGDYPIASSTNIGMVKVGEGLNVDSTTGELSVDAYEVATYSFDNVAAMVAYNLSEGDTAITAGYYSINDGGGGTYKIINSGATADGATLIELSNGLKAELVIDGKVNVNQFGAYGDGTHDDTAAIQKAFNATKIEQLNFVSSCTYLISDKITLYNRIQLNCNGAVIKANSANACLFISGHMDTVQKVYDLFFDGDFKANVGLEVSHNRHTLCDNPIIHNVCQKAVYCWKDNVGRGAIRLHNFSIENIIENATQLAACANSIGIDLETTDVQLFTGNIKEFKTSVKCQSSTLIYGLHAWNYQDDFVENGVMVEAYGGVRLIGCYCDGLPIMIRQNITTQYSNIEIISCIYNYAISQQVTANPTPIYKGSNDHVNILDSSFDCDYNNATFPICNIFENVFWSNVFCNKCYLTNYYKGQLEDENIGTLDYERINDVVYFSFTGSGTASSNASFADRVPTWARPAKTIRIPLTTSGANTRFTITNDGEVTGITTNAWSNGNASYPARYGLQQANI